MMNTIPAFATRLAGAASLALAISGCSLSEQTPPAVTGPSEFGLSVTLQATPDSIAQDGVSQALITAVARDPQGQPMPGITLQFSGSSSNPLIRELSFTETVAVTDASGRATTSLIAPPAPATVPNATPIITVAAVPVGSNFANAVPRTVSVRLTPPAGTPLMNLNPEAVIVADPRVANYAETIRFDASLTSDEGQACGTRCQYIWEFGDNTVAVRGITATHAYAFPGTYTVTLTVTDERGGFDEAMLEIRVIGPSAPIARLTASPRTVTLGDDITFSGATSTVGAGATIVRYIWDFGDGTIVDSDNDAVVEHEYQQPGSYSATLTVRDSLGREATSAPATVTVTAVPTTTP